METRKVNEKCAEFYFDQTILDLFFFWNLSCM